MLHILSLGAGVQSSTLALMAAAGEITPMPTAAIFADTQAEPASVYQWLDWLEAHLPFPVHRVTAGDLALVSATVRTARNGNKYTDAQVPLYLRSPTPGERAGIQRRQCTGDFKIDPIHRQIRTLLGGDPLRAWRRAGRPDPKPVRQWIGISLDEAHRMKPARPDYIENVWPLVDRRLTRADCLAWMAARRYPVPPRSACVFCPYHSDAEWRRLKTEDPEAFETAAQWEETYQDALAQVARIRGVPFLHQSCVPLRLVNFTQADTAQPNLFGNECEGMCGV